MIVEINNMEKKEKIFGKNIKYFKEEISE